MMNLVVPDAVAFAALVEALDQYVANGEDAIALGAGDFDARWSAQLTAAYALLEKLNAARASLPLQPVEG